MGYPIAAMEQGIPPEPPMVVSKPNALDDKLTFFQLRDKQAIGRRANNRRPDI
jgi:hypothetical protein